MIINPPDLGFLAPLTAPPELPPFAPETLAFLTALHRRLLSDPEARRFPDLQALGFWLRPAALARLEVGFWAGMPAGVVAVPRGLALHLPPANVNTMLIYSWLPALLTGNRSLIRVSERGGEAAALLLRLVTETLAAPEAARLAAANLFVRYPHDNAVTAALSQAADVRLLWGGDATIAHLRALPVAPHGLDLAFPDRVSWAALAAAAYLALDEGGRQQQAEALANDLFWYGQQACASPRLLLWCGAERAISEAAADLYPRLAARAPAIAGPPGPAERLERLTVWHRAALELPVAALCHYGDGILTVARLERFGAAECPALERLEAGLLVEARLEALEDCLPAVSRRVQTLACFGFAPETLAAFARRLNGRGIDRMVSLGQALSFSVQWDGIDLLRSLVRLVRVG